MKFGFIFNYKIKNIIYILRYINILLIINMLFLIWIFYISSDNYICSNNFIFNQFNIMVSITFNKSTLIDYLMQGLE